MRPTVADLPWSQLPEPLTRRLADWAYDLSYADLGQEEREAVVRLCRDFVVISLAASTGRGVGESSGPGLEPLVKLAALYPGSCTILGRDVTTTPQHAAIVNGAFAHTLNLMDVHRWSAPTHICPGVFPAVFALAETREVTFPEFAVAVVVGVEGIAKLGMALNVGQGVIDTTDANAPGAALAGAKILGLDRDGHADALGIGAYLAVGGTISLELTSPGYWTRPLLSGWQPGTGVISAMLAREGLRGSPRVLEAATGFLNARSLVPDPAPLSALGDPFEVTRVGLKPYPTTRYIHSEIEALLRIVVEEDLAPDDVERVVIEKPRSMHLVTGTDDRLDPSAPEVARLSSFFFAAKVIKDRRAWLDALEPASLHDAETKQLMDRVECRPAADLDAFFPEGLPARVTVEKRDGTSVTRTIHHPRGEPERPLSEAELMAKYNALYDYCLSDSMPRARFDEILARCSELESCEDIGAFVGSLGADAS